MKFRKLLLPILILVFLALAVVAAVNFAPGVVTAVSYWGYGALTPALIVAIVVCGWLIPRKD